MYEVFVYNEAGQGDVETTFNTEEEAILFAQLLATQLPETEYSVVVYHNNETIYEIIL